MGRHAYTLVEVLAVTVLLGLVASLGVPPMLRAMTGDPLDRAAGRMAQAFRDVRAQAYGHRLVLELTAAGFTATVSDDGVRSVLPPLRLPEDIQATWTRRGRPAPRLELDPRGHGLDTEVTLRLDERELSFAIDGLTGQWTSKGRP